MAAENQQNPQKPMPRYQGKEPEHSRHDQKRKLTAIAYGHLLHETGLRIQDGFTKIEDMHGFCGYLILG